MSDICAKARPAPVLRFPQEYPHAVSRSRGQVKQPAGSGRVSPGAIPAPPPIPESHSP